MTDAEQLIKRLNSLRIRCLTLLLPALASGGLAAYSLFLAVSTSVQLSPVIPSISAAVLLTACVFASVLFVRSRRVYENEFRKTTADAVLFDEYPDGTYDPQSNSLTPALECAHLLTNTDSVEVTERFGTSAEGFSFEFGKLNVGDEPPFGMLFVFTFGKKLRRSVQIRRKGLSRLEKPSALEANGLAKQETGDPLFDYAYIAFAESEAAAGVMLSEPVLQAFLTLDRDINGRAAASLYENHLCLYMNSVPRLADIPLFTSVKKHRLREASLSSVLAAVSLADNLVSEKRMWS